MFIHTSSYKQCQEVTTALNRLGVPSTFSTVGVSAHPENVSQIEVLVTYCQEHHLVLDHYHDAASCPKLEKRIK